MALEVADLNGYCYGSQDFSPVVWRRLRSLRFSMLVGRRIICPQTLGEAMEGLSQRPSFGGFWLKLWLAFMSFACRSPGLLTRWDNQSIALG